MQKSGPVIAEGSPTAIADATFLSKQTPQANTVLKAIKVELFIAEANS